MQIHEFHMQLIGFVVVLLFVQSVTSDAMAKRNSKWPIVMIKRNFKWPIAMIKRDFKWPIAMHKRGPNMIPNVPDSITDEVQSVTNDAMAKRNSKWPIVMIKRNFKWPIAMIKRGPPIDY
ncbi:uncharacterized protein LOC128183184 isoform X2 [Crassostrea angulata]|uniref:uncharacterized protein LOC128183184 isoform X2 n=1 Tax=Magallana angulata TaxID=2784310 RepID=UPI0022B08465|nr:uncharacterized protein LOC128183184 isoform X2 [Crassostrea angulata]